MSKKIQQAEQALLAQNHQLKKGENVLNNAHDALSSLQDINNQNDVQLDNVSNGINELLAQHGLSLDDFDDSPLDEHEQSLISLTEEEKQFVESKGLESASLDTISIGENWDEYIADIHKYGEKYSLDFSVDPMRQILSVSEYANIQNEYDAKFGNISWNKLDYGIVALSASLGFLVDFFIAGIPSDMSFKGKEYAGSPATKYLREQSKRIMNAAPEGEGLYSWLHNGQAQLEKGAKVAYDFPSNRPEILGTEVAGLSPGSHRLQTLGHDPILGFIVGVIDIMRGHMTVIGRDGVIQTIDRSEKFGTHNFFNALFLQVSHLLSDIPTPQGVPAPFLGVLQCVNMKSPFSLGPSGETVSFNDVSRFMYSHGYTFEHFLTMSLVPMVVEIVINTYYKLANFKTLFPNKDEYDPSKDVKFKSMLSLAHSMTMAGNVAKMGLFGWNPAAFNIAEMGKCFHSFYALYKAQQERDEKIGNYLLQEWGRLSIAGTR